MKVWLIQCLCSKRHCILAAVTEDEEEPSTLPFRHALHEALAAGALNPWCGICHSPSKDWTYEVGETEFTSLALALPALLELQARNIASGMVHGELSQKPPTRH